MRLIEINAPLGHEDSLIAIGETHNARHVYSTKDGDGETCLVRLLVDRPQQQPVIDAVQTLLSGTEKWSLMLLPVEAALPEPKPEQIVAESNPKKPAAKTMSREELQQEIAPGAELDGNYILFVLLATIVALIGLVTDNVAVIIGAMVIAPFLGPALAISFGTVTGNVDMLRKAASTLAIGLALAIGAGAASGLIAPEITPGPELFDRTEPGFGGIVLALASGAAAVLSLTTGISSALVGVMVAVAVLPPAVAAGLFVGLGQVDAGLGALILLGINLTAVLIAAQIILRLRGLGARRGADTDRAKRATRLMLLINLTLLAILSVLMVLRDGRLPISL
ncbi:MAG: TIGR00341 family protein [Alphaproteobacteria bacterium]